MVEGYVVTICDEVKSIFSDNIDTKHTNNSIILSGLVESGVKGVDAVIECSSNTVKIKGTREYMYPISEMKVEKFQEDFMEKFPGYSVYVTGQTFSFSRFFSYQNQSTVEAVEMIRKAVDVMKQAVQDFENGCVDFTEKTDRTRQEAEYNPESNINLVNIDNSYHAVSMTENDNEEYNESQQEFTETVFKQIAAKYGAQIEGNSFVVNDIKEGQRLKCILLALDAEILITVSIKVPSDVGAIYISYINANYPEIRGSYNSKKEAFVLKKYSAPDKYAPNETEEYIELCLNAMDACIREYEQTLHKKDSTAFVSDVQEILSKQTEDLAEREKAIAAREEEIIKREEQARLREEEYEFKISELEDAKAAMYIEMEKEKKRITEYEAEMQAKIKSYEERNTKDIMNIQQLAAQVSQLQNKQAAIGTNDEAEEEIFRLKSKVSQMTSQRIALEKKLNERLNEKDSKIRDFTEKLSKKESEIKKLQEEFEENIKIKVTEEVSKTEEKLKSVEDELAERGHILTPEEMMEYLEKYDIEVKKFHAPNAEILVYNDEALEIRVRFGELNYVDVSRVASMKDVMLRKFNSKFNNIKFFSKDDRIIARSYFKKEAGAEDVEELINSLAVRFSK